MSSNCPIYSAAKIGNRYFWIIQDSDFIYDPCRDALAEGFAPTKEDALKAIEKASKELGVEPREDRAGRASGYKKYWRDRDKKKAEPQSVMFQGLPYVWKLICYFDDHSNEHVREWKKGQIATVTNKYVFISAEYDMESRVRLNREELERDGHTTSRASGLFEDYYTEAGYQADLAKEAEKERQRQAEHAIWLEKKATRDEETRISLIGKTCVFCGEAPDRYTEDKHPACSPCHKKARGWYRVPPNMIVPFRTIDQ